MAGDLVAVAWEDNRSLSPQVYLALMAEQQRVFSVALQASGGRKAYEPSLDAVGNNRFVPGYEQDGAVCVPLLSVDGLGAAHRLGQSASHVSVADAGPFGPNEKVHGAEGDTLRHYNPTSAGSPAGEFVIAWDDFRRGDSNVWISGYTDELEWSADHAPAVASGSGEQSHPSLALDARGNQHLPWLERDSLDGPTCLWYSLGVAR